jgi:hypothetical protein
MFGTYLERDFKTGELSFGLGEADPFAHSWRVSLLQPLGNLCNRPGFLRHRDKHAANLRLPAAAAPGGLSGA